MLHNVPLRRGALFAVAWSGELNIAAARQLGIGSITSAVCILAGRDALAGSRHSPTSHPPAMDAGR
jgi:hypothetical protein